MNRIARCMLVATVLALPLGACGSLPGVPDVDVDPSEWIPNFELFNAKKPLPGERKPVFPQGVPGVARGVPSDLVKGNQNNAGEPQDTALQIEEPKPQPKAKPKPKPKPKVAAQPAPPPAQSSNPTSVTVRRPEPAAAPPSAQQPQWPDPPPVRQAPAAQWPDPPPPR
jgi:hypothetical protein